MTAEQLIAVIGIPIVTALTGAIGTLFVLLMKQTSKFEITLKETTAVLTQVRDRLDRCRKCVHYSNGGKSDDGSRT